MSLVLGLQTAGAGSSHAASRAESEALSEGQATSATGSAGTRVEGIPPPLLPDLCPYGMECPPVLGSWEEPQAPSFLRIALPEGGATPASDGTEERARHIAWRRSLSGGLGVAGFYGALYTWAYFAWYRGRPRNAHIEIRWEGAFGGETYGGGADKLGHFFSSYAIARGTAEYLHYMGWRPWVASLLGSALSLTWFAAIEFKDGMHRGYGFSPEDMISNTLGVLTSALMVAWPAFDRLFDVRMYYRPSKPFTTELLIKRNVDLAEDYTGSTYMVAFHLEGLPWIRDSRWLRPLRFVDLLVGYNARGFLPRPTNDRWRDRELFFAFSLNLVALLEATVPGSRVHHLFVVAQEFFQFTPVARLVRIRAYNDQPKKSGH